MCLTYELYLPINNTISTLLRLSKLTNYFIYQWQSKIILLGLYVLIKSPWRTDTHENTKQHGNVLTTILSRTTVYDSAHLQASECDLRSRLFNNFILCTFTINNKSILLYMVFIIYIFNYYNYLINICRNMSGKTFSRALNYFTFRMSFMFHNNGCYCFVLLFLLCVCGVCFFHLFIFIYVFCVGGGARCSSAVRAFAHGGMGRRIDPSWGGPIELHDWCNKGRGMCYPVCGMMHIKEPLLLVGKSSPCGGSGFPPSKSEWSFTICMTPYNRK